MCAEKSNLHHSQNFVVFSLVSEGTVEMHVDDDGGLGEYTSLSATSRRDGTLLLVATTVDRTLVVLQRDSSNQQQQQQQRSGSGSGKSSSAGSNSSGLRRSRAIVGDNDAISDVSFIDGVRLAVACNSALVRLVDLRTLQCTLLAGHTDTVLAVACSADGRRLATSGKDGTVRVYQLFRDDHSVGNKRVRDFECIVTRCLRM